MNTHQLNYTAHSASRVDTHSCSLFPVLNYCVGSHAVTVAMIHRLTGFYCSVFKPISIPHLRKTHLSWQWLLCQRWSNWKTLPWCLWRFLWAEVANFRFVAPRNLGQLRVFFSQGFVNRFPDIRIEQLMNLLMMRGDVSRNEAKQVSRPLTT